MPASGPTACSACAWRSTSRKYTTPALRAQFLTELGDRLKALAGRPVRRRRRDVSDERRRRISRGRAHRGSARGRGGAAAAGRGAVGIAGLLPDRRDSAPARDGSSTTATSPIANVVAVISDSMARQFFPDRPTPSARGSRPTTGAAGLRIVGIVGDVRSTLAVAAVADVLSSARAGAAADRHVPGAHVGRPGGARPADARRRARDRSRSSRSISSGRSTRCARRRSSAPRLTATLIGVFAGIALLITAAGLAGVIAFSVNQRVAGVRRPHGARRLARVGAAARPRPGAAPRRARPRARGVAAIALSSTVRALLFDTQPTDIPTFVGVAVVLAIVALVACLLPARRASSVDPLVVLRGN